MDSSYNDSTTDKSGDFWAKEDEEIAKAEDAKYARARRILRAQEFMERQRAPKYEPSTMDNMITDVMQTIDGGFTQLSDFAFGTRTQKAKTTTEQQPLEEKVTEAEEPAPLTKEEIEQYELEALRALVDGDEPKIPLDRLNAIRSADPPTALEEESQKEESLPTRKRSFVDNDEGSDLRELEIQINRYIDLIKKHDDDERRARVHTKATHDDENNLMAILKEVEKRQEEEQLEPFQYQRQNLVRNGEHQIWNYVGEYYSGGVKRNTNPTRVAPSPENILGRMAPKPETDEARQARVNRMLDALDRRMAQKGAARRQYEDYDDEFERALQRRQLKKQQSRDENMLFGLLIDLNLINIEEEEEEEELDGESTFQRTDRLSSTLDKLDQEFYKEIKQAEKEESADSSASKSGESKSRDTGVVENGEEEEEDGFEGGCLGCGTEQVEEDQATLNGVPLTKADTTNIIDSQRVAYTPLNDEVSDASEESTRNRGAQQTNKEDPPENNGWFSFFAPAPERQPEPEIPEEIHLEDPPEEIRQEPEEPKEQVHVKKGLKIVAILEGSDEAVQVGTTASKPIMIRDEEPTTTNEAPGNHLGCWAGSQADLLTSE